MEEGRDKREELLNCFDAEPVSAMSAKDMDRVVSYTVDAIHPIPFPNS